MALLAGTTGATDFLVGSGQTYSTITGAVEAVRLTASGTHTVRIMDSATYAESVKLDHANFSSITLTIEAASGQTPTLHSFRTTSVAGNITMPGLTLRRLRFDESLLGAQTPALLGAAEIGLSDRFRGNVTIESCTFTAAATTSWGVGVYCRMDNASYKVTVTNCNFYLSGSTSLSCIDTYSGANKMGLEVFDCVFIGSTSLVHYGIRDRNTATSSTAAMNIRNNFFYYLRAGFNNSAAATAPVGHITIENNTFVKCDGTASTFGSILIPNRTAPLAIIRDNLVVSSGVNAFDGLVSVATAVTDWDADYNAFVNMKSGNVGYTNGQMTVTTLNNLASADNNQLNNTLTPTDLFVAYGGTDYRNDYRLKSGVWALTAASDSSYVGAFGIERPTVTVTANDAAASETGPDNGQFTISRGSRTDGALTVNYTLPDAVGRATPGSGAGGDYTTTPAANYGARTGSVTIPDTATSATVTMTPVDNATSELSEDVVLTLATDAAYVVGSPSSATVAIADDDAGNVAPSVDAGTNQTVVVNTLPTGNVTLDATLVADDGTPVAATFLWTKQSGPGTVTFPGGDTALDTTATFSVAGTYVLLLTADDTALQGSDTVTIVVQDNEAPTVDAGSAQNATLAATVSLDGTVTVDDGLPTSPGLTYLWTQDSGPGTATFGSSTNIDTTATFNQVGEYVLKLTATDGLGLFGSDTVTITVRANAAFTAITNGRFNAAATWDAPGGTNGPPLAGDTAGITNWTVETLSANEVPAAAIVNLSGTGILRCRDSGATLSPVAATATNNVSSGGTLRVDNNNNLVGTVNLNGGRLMQQTGSDVTAGATMNVNANSEIAAAGTGDRCRIRAAVHGTGKLTVTGNPGSVTGDGFAFAAGSTWSGAWDIQSGYVRINTPQALPGNLRIASAGTVSHSDTGMTIKGVRSGSGSNVVYQAGTLTVGNGTTNVPGRGWWSPGDVGINNDVGLATFGNDFNSAGYSPTLRFASNSVFEADIRGVTADLYDRTVVFGLGSGTGKVDIATGAILTVNLWTPTGQATLNAKIIDTATGTGGDGVLTGSFSHTNWVNAGGWHNLGVTVVGNDLYVTGERAPSGTVILLR
jgi:hypothetical protein